MVWEYNAMLKENAEMFHAFFDQAALCVNEEKPNCSKKEYLCKDSLHPNQKGGQLVADNVNLDWFR